MTEKQADLTTIARRCALLAAFFDTAPMKKTFGMQLSYGADGHAEFPRRIPRDGIPGFSGGQASRCPPHRTSGPLERTVPNPLIARRL